MEATVMGRMGAEAVERAAGWLAEAETAFGLSGYGGVAEVVRRVRAELEGVTILAGMGSRQPALAHA